MIGSVIRSFFFSSRRRHTRLQGDWSSDVCSSDLIAYWRTELLRSDELPNIASSWMANGLDSPSLRELAGVLHPEMSDVEPLFKKAIMELNIELPTKDEALITIARHYASQIVNQTITPYEGATKIWWEVSNHYGKQC